MGRSIGVGDSKYRRWKSKRKRKSKRKIWSYTTKRTQRTQQQRSFDLNVDCLSEIFSYLDIFDLVNVAAAACTNFVLVARDVFSRTFAKDVVTVTSQYTTAGEVPSVLLLTQFGDLISKLRVTYYESFNSRFDCELEEAISEYCKKTVIEMEFKYCKELAFIRIEQPFEAVVSVLFTKCDLGSLISKFNALFPKARRLDFMEIDDFTACTEKNFPHIEHLGFCYPTYYMQMHHLNIDYGIYGSIMDTLYSNQQLRSLTLKCFGMRLTSICLRHINEILPLLDTLDILTCSYSGADPVHFKSLRTLKLIFFESSNLSQLLITTRLPSEITLCGRWLNSDLGKFLSTNQKWTKIVLHGLWAYHSSYEEFRSEITKMKLLESIEMSVYGLKGKENDVLSLLNECQFLNKLTLHSGNFFAAEVKLMKATTLYSLWKAYGGCVALLAACVADSYDETLVRKYMDDDTSLRMLRNEFQLKFKDSTWLTKFNTVDVEEGDYGWTEYTADYEKNKDFNGK